MRKATINYQYKGRFNIRLKEEFMMIKESLIFRLNAMKVEDHTTWPEQMELIDLLKKMNHSIKVSAQSQIQSACSAPQAKQRVQASASSDSRVPA